MDVTISWNLSVWWSQQEQTETEKAAEVFI